MAYIPKRDVVIVEFEEGHRCHGLEARCFSKPPMGLFFDLTEAFDGVGEEDKLSPEQMLQMRSVMSTFASDILISWNLAREDGTPIEPTYGGLRTQDLEFGMEVMQGYMAAVSQPSVPLGVPSSNGSTSEVSTTPMAVS